MQAGALAAVVVATFTITLASWVNYRAPVEMPRSSDAQEMWFKDLKAARLGIALFLGIASIATLAAGLMILGGWT